MDPRLLAARGASNNTPTDPITQIIERVAETVAERVLERYSAERGPRKRLVSLGEACVALDCSQPSLRRLIERGLPTISILSARKIDLDEAVAWLRQHGAANAGEP